MKIAIVYVSIHHGNTKIIAENMAKRLGADLLPLEDFSAVNLGVYDMIGFGSGIFYSKHHSKLFEFIENTNLKNKNVFVFSTSGTGSIKNNTALKEKLLAGDAKIMGDFSCKGYDTYGIFKWIGGISKGRPNSKDIENAFNFCDLIRRKNEVSYEK